MKDIGQKVVSSVADSKLDVNTPVGSVKTDGALSWFIAISIVALAFVFILSGKAHKHVSNARTKIKNILTRKKK